MARRRPTHSPISPFVRPSVREKNVCNRKNTGVTCAPIAAVLHPTQRLLSSLSHETRLPHRQAIRNVAPPPRCGRMRAAERQRHARATRRQRYPSRLSLFPEIGRPDLRGTRKPSDAHPGVFLFRHSQREFRNARDDSRRERFRAVAFPQTFPAGTLFRSILHRTSGHRGPRMGRAVAEFRQEALPCCVAMLDAGCGRKLRRNDAHTNRRLATAGDAKHRSNGVQRHGLWSHPVRAALPWRIPDAGRGCFTKTELAQSGRAAVPPQVAGSNPVLRAIG